MINFVGISITLRWVSVQSHQNSLKTTSLSTTTYLRLPKQGHFFSLYLFF